MSAQVVRVPPDTAVPKKPMTLKRLRKAQRIQEAVKLGNEDSSKSRVWPAVKTDSLVEVTVPLGESMVIDLGSDPMDFFKAEEPEPVVVDTGKKPDKKAKSKAPAAAAVVEVEAKASLLPEAWIAQLKKKTAIRGLVSTAQRSLVNERDVAVGQYEKFIHTLLEDLKEEYDLVLRQEDSWNERWRRQVGMLRTGDL